MIKPPEDTIALKIKIEKLKNACILALSVLEQNNLSNCYIAGNGPTIEEVIRKALA